VVDWEVKKLVDVGNIFSGNSINAKIKKEKYTNVSSGIPYIATKDISYNSVINYDNGISIPKNGLNNFRVAHGNSIFICAEGGSAGRKLAFNTKEVCFVNKLFALEPFEFMEPKFIYYFYQTTDFQKQFMSKMTGLIGGVSMGKFKKIDILAPPLTEQKHIVVIFYGKSVTISSVNQANINGTKLKSYPIPLPSLSEQQSIVTKLDALSAETKRLEAVYEKKLADLEELKKSILQKAFDGELK
jgi:type I restriction enzyme S subunit